MTPQLRVEQLALGGGPPIRQGEWPKWPRADINTEHNVLDVLRAGPWAISGMYSGRPLYEQKFAEAFAAFHDVPFCVPTCNGSAALTIALEALGVGPGDEVLVPGVTWVACASAVAAVGAIPILVDVESDTLCMSLDCARRAITSRTAAILLVHLYCSVADLDGFVALAAETNIPLIEDCSQAHGASWRGQRVGTFGRIGVFSMQESKVLTCGEGGATITGDQDLYNLMQELRCDGRRYSATPPRIGEGLLEEYGSIQGRNFCLSEFHSAILFDRLTHVDTENRQREANADYLRDLLRSIGGVQPLQRLDGVDRLTYYQFCLRFDRPEFGNRDIEVIRCALMAELTLVFETIDAPLNASVLYNPLRSPRLPHEDEIRSEFDPTRFKLPVSIDAQANCLTFPHRALLGSRSDVEDIAAAIAKVKRLAEDLPDSV